MNFNYTRSWPHPVLTPLSDDVSPNEFDFVLDITPDHQRWLLGVRVSDRDETLRRYIGEGCAHYLLHIDCKKTYYRNAFVNSNSLFEVSIPGDLLFGLVEVSLLVVASTDIERYRHEGQHSDYGESTFAVNVGEPLAVAPSKSFEAYLEADPILKLSSIVDIKKGDESLRVMTVNCHGDRIVIELPPSDLVRYRELRADQKIRGFLVSTVVMPALLDGLFQLRSLTGPELEDFKSAHRWSRCVLAQLERMKIEITNLDAESGMCLRAAQALLREPLRRSLEDLTIFLSKI